MPRTTRFGELKVSSLLQFFKKKKKKNLKKKRRNHLMLNNFSLLRTRSLAVYNNLSEMTSEQSSSSSSAQQDSSPFNASARQPSNPPKLWNEQVQNYFILLDSWLERFNIHSELDKFYILISAMSEDQQCRYGSDIGHCATQDNPYTNLRKRILGNTDKLCPWQWVIDLQNANILPNEKPSEFMRRLLTLAKPTYLNDQTAQEVIIACFYSKLPQNTVSMLNMLDKTNIDEIARLADCAINLTENGLKTDNTSENIFQMQISSQLQELCTEVSNLKLQNKSVLSKPTHNNQSHAYRQVHNKHSPYTQHSHFKHKNTSFSNSQSQPYSNKPPNSVNFNQQGWCWYHATYFENALKCMPGCTFKQQASTFNTIRLNHSFPVSGLPQVLDKISGQLIILDSGACHSFLPATAEDKINPPPDSESRYYSASRDPVKYYGTVCKEVDIGFGPMSWTFCLCDVQHVYLGWDFLAHFDITVRRISNPTSSDSNCIIKHWPSNSTVVALDFTPTTSTDLEIHTSDYMKLLSQFPSITEDIDFNVAPKHNIQHTIITTDRPVVTKARRWSPEMSQKIKEEIELQLEKGLIEPSDSEWANPLHVVPKSDGMVRLVGDYRLLNKQIKADRYNLPHIQDFTNRIQHSTVFSTVDMRSAFNQIPMHPDHKHKTSVITPWGLFAFKAMPFGLKTSAQQWQRLMDVALRGLRNHFCYVDDIIVFSKNEADHMIHLEQLFSRLDEFGLKVNPKKCHFGKSEVKFLGFLVNENGCSPLPDRVEAIQKLPLPTTTKQLRSFVGVLQYYRRAIPKIAELLSPLHKLLQGKKKYSGVKFTEDAKTAFESAKLALVNTVAIAHPRDNAKTTLVSDASDTAVGAVLQQLIDGIWRPLGYFSKTLSPTQKKYATFDRELLAAYTAF